MRKSLQGTLIAGMMSVGLLALSSSSFGQHEYDWGNPNIPYVEQRGFSLGLNLGQTDIWGDVGTKSVLDHYVNDNYYTDLGENLRFMGGMFLRYTHVPGVSFRLGVNYGKLYATDAWNEEKALKAETIQDDSYQRYLRNLDIKTNIWEGNFIVELSPFRLSNWEFGGMTKARFQPYVLLGVSGFYFNPRGTYKDLTNGREKEVDLQPLRTEGQGFTAPGYTFPETYSNFSYAALGGIGFKVDIGKGLALGLEYQLRYTFTDYLDDVSGRYVDPLLIDIAYVNQLQKTELVHHMADRSKEIIPGYEHQGGAYRGNPDNNDMFSSVSIMFFWKINKRASPWWFPN